MHNLDAFNGMLAFNKKNPEMKNIYRELQLRNSKKDMTDGVYDSFYVEAFPEYMQKLLQVREKITKKATSIFGSTPPSMYEKLNEQFGQQMFMFSNELRIYSAWRNTLGIYRIDKDIYNQITKSKIPEDTPISIFERLPEWCVYIELPEDNDFCEKDAGFNGLELKGARGFWAYLDYEDSSKTRRTLNICLDPIDAKVESIAGVKALEPISLLIDETETIEESVRHFFLRLLPRSYVDKEKKDEDGVRYITEIEWQLMTITNNNKKEELESRFEYDKNLVIKALSLLLWLCAEEPDITNIAGEPVSGEELRKPSYSVHKKTGIFIPPSSPNIRILGGRLGGEVRMFNKKNKPDSDNDKGVKLHSRKRPHIRRGHWHGAWKGSGQNKQFFLYWQPAVFVNSGI